MRTLSTFLAATLFAATIAPRVARADDPPADETPEEKQARELYEKGITHYDVAEYDEAIAAFKEAYKISKKPGLLYNIAQAYRLKGDCQNALTFYKTYLRQAPDAENRAKVEQRIAEMEECVKSATPPQPDKEPVKEPLEPQKDGTKPDITKDSSPPPDMKMPPAQDTGDEHPGRSKRIVGYTLVGVGVAAVATGVAFGLAAKDASDEIQAFYDMAGPHMWTDELEATETRGERDETIALGLYIVGGAAVAAGVTFWWLGHRAEGSATAVSIAPLPGGARVGWAVTF